MRIGNMGDLKIAGVAAPPAAIISDKLLTIR
jgi:hypothetical protein